VEVRKDYRGNSENTGELEATVNGNISVWRCGVSTASMLKKPPILLSREESLLSN